MCALLFLLPDYCFSLFLPVSPPSSLSLPSSSLLSTLSRLTLEPQVDDTDLSLPHCLSAGAALCLSSKDRCSGALTRSSTPSVSLATACPSVSLVTHTGGRHTRQKERSRSCSECVAATQVCECRSERSAKREEEEATLAAKQKPRERGSVVGKRRRRKAKQQQEQQVMQHLPSSAAACPAFVIVVASRGARSEAEATAAAVTHEEPSCGGCG